MRVTEYTFLTFHSIVCCVAHVSRCDKATFQHILIEFVMCHSGKCKQTCCLAEEHLLSLGTAYIRERLQ